MDIHYQNGIKYNEEHGWNTTYKHRSKTGYFLSGKNSDGIIYYQKTVKKDFGSYYTIRIEYPESEKDFGDYTQVIDFPTFLLHVLAIWEGKDTSEVQLDDKKLLTLFDIKNKNETWVIEFSEFLLRMKHIFDNFIVIQKRKEKKEI